MRFLASFAMRGRSQAVVAAFVLTALSFPIPPLSILSSAVIALVTLRRGHIEGLVVVALAGLASGVIAYVVLGTASPAVAVVLSMWLPALIAAVVLFSFGTGPIKGFAVTLFIGILTSMFTAILGSRAIINLIYGQRRVSALAI